MIRGMSSPSSDAADSPRDDTAAPDDGPSPLAAPPPAPEQAPDRGSGGRSAGTAAKASDHPAPRAHPTIRRLAQGHDARPPGRAMRLWRKLLI